MREVDYRPRNEAKKTHAGLPSIRVRQSAQVYYARNAFYKTQKRNDMKTTLNQIREKSPCADVWKKLLAHLGKTQADDEPLSLITILDSNGLDDALWCLRAVKNHDREIRLYAVWCARQVQHLMTDKRSLDALDVAERFANGLATADELAAAMAAAWAASRAAARAAAGAAARAAARDEARATAWAAARDAAGAAARDAAGAAARAAAGDEARDAARDGQEKYLREFCAEIEFNEENT